MFKDSPNAASSLTLEEVHPRGALQEIWGQREGWKNPPERSGIPVVLSTQTTWRSCWNTLLGPPWRAADLFLTSSQVTQLPLVQVPHVSTLVVDQLAQRVGGRVSSGVSQTWASLQLS